MCIRCPQLCMAEEAAEDPSAGPENGKPNSPKVLYFLSQKDEVKRPQQALRKTLNTSNIVNFAM